jgi:SEC-C motif-containing protein
MRSRYSAFALGLGEYLVRTLASSHPDAQYDPTELARILSRTRESQRFLGLRILDARAGATASESEVLFYARIFERGVDRSFAELSTFVREGVGAESALRYASGILVPAARLPTPLEALTRDAFVALAERP